MSDENKNLNINGSPDFLYEMGLSFVNDQQDPSHQAMAASLFLRAAEMGHVDAMYELGMCYRWGDGGVYADPDEALKWFRAAKEKGHEKAGRIVEEFDSESGKLILLQSAISGVEGYGTKWYKSKTMVDEYYRLAEEGDGEAQYELARQLEFPHHVGPFKGNIQECIKWYEKAAENHVIDAMFNLAIIYKDGKCGITPDLEKRFFGCRRRLITATPRRRSLSKNGHRKYSDC